MRAYADQECSIFLSATDDWSLRLNFFSSSDGDRQTCCNDVCEICGPGP